MIREAVRPGFYERRFRDGDSWCCDSCDQRVARLTDPLTLVDQRLDAHTCARLAQAIKETGPPPPPRFWTLLRASLKTRGRIWIREAELIPRGYGVAWKEWDRNLIVCLPLGVNLVARWLRSAWHWTKCSYQPSLIDRMYEVGYHAGQNDQRRRHEDAVRAEWLRRSQDHQPPLEPNHLVEKVREYLDHKHPKEPQ